MPIGHPADHERRDFSALDRPAVLVRHAAPGFADGADGDLQCVRPCRRRRCDRPSPASQSGRREHGQTIQIDRRRSRPSRLRDPRPSVGRIGPAVGLRRGDRCSVRPTGRRRPKPVRPPRLRRPCRQSGRPGHPGPAWSGRMSGDPAARSAIKPRTTSVPACRRPSSGESKQR